VPKAEVKNKGYRDVAICWNSL